MSGADRVRDALPANARVALAQTARQIKARYGSLLGHDATLPRPDVAAALASVQRERATDEAQKMVDAGQMNLLEASLYLDAVAPER